eukprot:Platyproteum_vivax@DN5359_c0_g1_i2.p1
MDSVQSAQAAKDGLDGQNIYAGCNSLKVHYSSMSHLQVKQSNDKCYDFVNSSTKSLNNEYDGLLPTRHPMSPLAAGSPFMIPHSPTSPLHYSPPVAGFGWTIPGVNSPIAFNAPLAAAPMYEYANGRAPVLIVKNLEETQTKCDELAALFAVYGNVQRVKIMFKLRSVALVQLGDIVQCSYAKMHLSNVPLHGKQLQVELSTAGAIPPPPAGSSKDDSQLTQDFPDANYNRHKPERSLKMFPPSHVLHFSNLPGEIITEQILTEAIAKHASPRPTNIKFLDANKYMAMVRMLSVEEAVEVLVKCHNHEIKGRPARIAFGISKK